MQWENSLFCGDNLDILRNYIPDECVDLVYIDPPFFSNRNYAVIWGDEAERRSFEDIWEGGMESYVSFMDVRLRELRRIMKPHASIYVHCDWHASHRIRLLMDKIFGTNCFQNEIIWYYRGGGVSKNYFGRRHDNIYFYGKSPDIRFYPDTVRLPYAEPTIKRFAHKIGNVRGGRDYGIQKLHPTGKHPDDVWLIQPIAPSAGERLGYPTQKPERLLENIIGASTQDGDLVFDAFCGCGTTLAVAQRLGRKWIGIDISYTAIELVKERLAKLGVNQSRIIGMPTTTEDALRLQPFDFQTWVLKKLHCYASRRKTADLGIDGYTYFRQHPVQIKKSERIGRNVIDNFVAAMKREGKSRGFVVAVSFGPGAIGEVHRLRNDSEVDITLIELDEVINGYIIEE